LNKIQLIQSASQEIMEELISIKTEYNNKRECLQNKNQQLCQEKIFCATKPRRYHQDLENNRAKQRLRYKRNLENNRAKKRRRYEQDVENNCIKKRKRHLKIFQYERDRQKIINCDRKWFNKRYYEKRKLKSNLVKKNCDIAEKIITKYKKFWS